MKVTAWKCSYCGLFFEGLIDHHVCPRCDIPDYVKKVATFPTTERKYEETEEA